MKPIKVKAFFIMSVLAILTCSVFACFQPVLLANAATFSSTNAELKLVGFQGYSPIHYFDNLKQVSIDSVSNYTDDDDRMTDEYYIVKSNTTSLFGEYSTGSTSITPYSDYITLADANVLHAYAKTGIVAGSSTSKNKVTISLQHNGTTQTATNENIGGIVDNIYTPYYYQTQSIKIVSNSNLNFSFTNNATSNLFSKADFKLFEPSIVFKTKINSVSFLNSNQTIYHGDVVKLNGTNAILNINETTSLVNYYKSIHKMQYEIVEGSQYATIIGNYIYFTGETSGTVKVKAKAIAESDTNNFVYSENIVTFTYISQKKDISVNQNFTGGATITGLGQYYIGDDVSLVANVNTGYTFSHWVLNGQPFYTKSIYFVCGPINQIELYTIKDIQISQIIIKDRYYDGTTNAEIDSIVLNGILDTHDAYLSTAEAKYYTESVGTKILGLTITPYLEGEDAIWYRLSSVIPTIYGNILPRPATLTILPSQKVYGDVDSAFEYQITGLVENETLNQVLTRQSGEDVGSYLISATVDNPNYMVTIVTNSLTITSKALTVSQMDVTKEYDKTTQISISPSLLGLAFNDSVTATITADFADANVGENITLLFDDVVFFGDKKDNYTLDLNLIPFTSGSITPKEVYVKITNATKIYGDTDPTYEITYQGLIEGDDLNGVVTRASLEQVGNYPLTFINNNANYEAVTSLASLTITPKTVSVTALASSKTYGDSDPVFGYTSSGLVGQDTFTGSLQRNNGETVGTYTINVGTISNPNYTINFTSNTFTINKRQLEGTITFESKVYDGTTDINGFVYHFTNLVSTDQVVLSLEAQFSSKDVGQDIHIEVTSYDLSNQNYSLNISNFHADITKRTLTIHADNNSKTYGQPDGEMSYTVSNIVQGETLNGTLSRTSGENVSTYQILLGTITTQNNPNYTITLSNSYYAILQRTIYVKTVSMSKFYAEQDPVNTFELTNYTSLAFDDVLSDVIGGKPGRVTGEKPGIYPYHSGTLYVKDNNYAVEFSSFGQLTIKKIDIVVTADNQTKTYGDADPNFTYTTNIAPVSEFNFGLTRMQGELVGTYLIQYISLYNEYYNISYQGSTLTITPRNLVIKADNKIKYYGSSDPSLTYAITSGILVYNNTLTEILSGTLSRQAGETLGNYAITSGNLSIDSNYSFDFIAGTLSIYKQDITIEANPLTKPYNSSDPELTYTIKQGTLAFDDAFSGQLVRQAGENIGGYQISQGTLALNENYNLIFQNSIFTITKANITVSIPSLEKQYGDNDPVITYSISGNFKQGEVLNGTVSRQSGETVGQYSYVSSLSNSNYTISYDMGVFTIAKRLIKISAESYVITYSQPVPTLAYHITYGNIIPGDTLLGEIYKVAGDDAGVYDINSTFNLGRNYKIEYTKGTVTILPISLKLASDGASKVYGENDPRIDYVIQEGQLVGDDVLEGFITREEGSSVGVYNLVPSFSNTNYTIEIISGVFEIMPKEVTLYTTALDKVYDGTTTAYINKPAVIGLLDADVIVSYNPLDVANFVTEQVGDNIDVILHSIYLVGENAINYHLVLPVLKANITHAVLVEQGIQVYAQKNTQLSSTVDLVVSTFEDDAFVLPSNKVILKEVSVLLMKGNNQLDQLSSDIQIKINLETNNYQNVKVYRLDDNGTATILESKFENGVLSFETNSLGNIVVVADDLTWLDLTTFASFITLFVMAAVIIIGKIKKVNIK